jgi:sugar phosphate isomerase/epimerase
MHTANLQETLKLAKDTGYEGIEVNIQEIADLIDHNGIQMVKELFCEFELWPGGWGLPVDWRGDEEKWRSDLEKLPRLAAASSHLGCTRSATWILPGSNDRTYDENKKFHIERFQPVAQILAEHDCHLGLEFIGPKTMRESFRYPFIWRMQDMLELAKEIDLNVGLLLDCWHWHTSGATIEDILKLNAEDVVYVHVSDAPIGVSMDAYIDSRRCLPGATGVIDLTGFLRSLKSIGYEGPVTPEPFGNPAIWTMDGLAQAWTKI